jgi:2-polyprenyl-6-methoxyphenol hydroxylase-like FAD-dependent oxidoreductase
VAAADGLSSAVRAALFPDVPSPRYTGLVGTGGIGYVPDVPPTDGVMRMSFGRKAYFGYIKEADGPVLWFNSYPAAERDLVPIDDPVAYADFLRSLHADDPEPNRQILAALPAMERFYPIYDLPPLATWHTRRVVLLGDAAHAVAPHAGQGASMALEDAVVLAACLGEADAPEAAFRRFESLRKQRTLTVMRIARQNGAQKRASNALSIFLRDLLLPVFIPLGIKQARRIASFRVDRAPLALPG